MRAQGRQAVAGLVQGLAQAGDVAMAEDRENTGEQRDFLAVDLGVLRHEKAHQRLGHGQADRGHLGGLRSNALVFAGWIGHHG